MWRRGAVISLFPSPSRGLLHTTLSLRHMRRTPQSGGLPLHYAAAGGASVEVITFLLEAYKDAAFKEDQARLCDHAAACAAAAAQFPPFLYLSPLYLPTYLLTTSSSRAAATTNPTTAMRVVCAGRKAAAALRR